MIDNPKSFLKRSLYEIKNKQPKHQRRVDLHTRTMYAIIIDQDTMIVKKKIQCKPDTFLSVVASNRYDIVASFADSFKTVRAYHLPLRMIPEHGMLFLDKL